MHINQGPAPRKHRAVFPIQKHHPRHDAYVVLPAVPKLVPPLAFYDLRLVDLVDGPEVGMGFVEENGLEDVLVVRLRRLICVLVFAELMLVVCAVEGHFDLGHVLRVGVRVVHGAVAGGFVVGPRAGIFGEGDLGFLLFRFWGGTEVGVEGCFEV